MQPSFREGDECVEVVARFTQVHCAFSQASTWQQNRCSQQLGLKLVSESDSAEFLLQHAAIPVCSKCMSSSCKRCPKSWPSWNVPYFECCNKKIPSLPSLLYVKHWSSSGRNRCQQRFAAVAGLSWLGFKRIVFKISHSFSGRDFFFFF